MGTKLILENKYVYTEDCVFYSIRFHNSYLLDQKELQTTVQNIESFCTHFSSAVFCHLKNKSLIFQPPLTSSHLQLSHRFY